MYIYQSSKPNYLLAKRDRDFSFGRPDNRILDSKLRLLINTCKNHVKYSRDKNIFLSLQVIEGLFLFTELLIRSLTYYSLSLIHIWPGNDEDYPSRRFEHLYLCQPKEPAGTWLQCNHVRESRSHPIDVYKRQTGIYLLKSEKSHNV